MYYICGNKCDMKTIDEVVKTKFKDEKHRFLANLKYSSNWIHNLFIDLLEPYKLSPEQFNVLRILRGNGDWVAMGEVRDLMIDKTPNLTRLVDKLIDKELIERKRCTEDRRNVNIRIVDKGYEVLKQIDMLSDTHLDWTENISDEEARTVSRILDKMRG